MVTLELFDRARCSREDKAGVVVLIGQILSLADKARREGILALEDELQNLGRPFMKTLLDMVVDSFDPELISAFGETTIAASGWSGAALLEAMITLEGMLRIQDGTNPYATARVLSAYLGVDSDLLDIDTVFPPDQGLSLDSITVEEPADEPRHGDTSIESIMADIENSLRLTDDQVATLRSFTTADDPFRNAPADTLAIALLYLEEADRVRFFDAMPPETKVAVVRKICDLSATDAGRYIDLARKSLQRMIEAAEASYKPAGGVEVATALLRSSSDGVVKTVLQAIEEDAPDLASRIAEGMFVFDDLVLLDDRAIQKVMRELDTHDIAHALKGASPVIRQKFFNNLSTRASAALKEEMAMMGPVMISSVQEAQEKIGVIVRHLEEFGEIVIPRPGEENLL